MVDWHLTTNLTQITFITSLIAYAIWSRLKFLKYEKKFTLQEII